MTNNKDTINDFLKTANKKELINYYMKKIKSPTEQKDISDHILEKNRAFHFLTGFFLFTKELRDDDLMDFNEENIENYFEYENITTLLKEYNDNKKYNDNSALLYKYLNKLPTQDPQKAHKNIISIFL